MSVVTTEMRDARNFALVWKIVVLLNWQGIGISTKSNRLCAVADGQRRDYSMLANTFGDVVAPRLDEVSDKSLRFLFL